MILQYSGSHFSQWLLVSRSCNWGSGGHLDHVDELVCLSATPGGGLPPRVIFFTSIQNKFTCDMDLMFLVYVK